MLLRPCADKNKNLSVFSYVEVFWWARVDIASRASKKALLGLFCPPDCTAGRSCSNPPAFVSFTHIQNKKLQRSSYVEALLGGAKQPKSEPLPSGMTAGYDPLIT